MTKILLAGILSFSVLLNNSAADDSEKKGWTKTFQIYAPIIFIGGQHVNHLNIPDRIRTVEAFTHIGTSVLEKNVEYNQIFFGIGTGIGFFNRLRLDLEYSGLNVGKGDRGTLGEKDFYPFDEYVGYVVENRFLKTSISVNCVFGVYLKASYGHNFGQIVSGSDAYSNFHPAYRVNLPNEIGGSVFIKPQSAISRLFTKKDFCYDYFGFEIGYSRSLSKKEELKTYRFFGTVNLELKVSDFFDECCE